MTTVVFLAEAPGSASLEEQKEGLGPDDLAVFAGNKSLAQLSDLLYQAGSPLQAGDRVKIHDFNCISLTTDMMVRALTKLLSEGVTIEVVAAGVVIEPGSAPAALLLAGLERHYRHLHALKANPEKKRQPVIKPEQMPAIRKRLSAPGATAASVAQELGIGRSTLFRYLERFGDDGGLNRPHQAKKGRSQNAGD
ncbi:helix-turn-helix domain-containing protein [Novosphingobium rosa]|uniref:helix-turn-helix domain-containing protein n=1 Tax=Novosphingobium rosa TaxID=76978 RepID=UPI000A01DF4E|nr:helix-turn-helix domain-containing protein [Novosphingobium rosa]